MNEDYYEYNSTSFRRWAPFYNLIALPLVGVRKREILRRQGLKIIHEAYGLIDFIRVIVCEFERKEARALDCI
ncbi:MAG: hypothetical protein PVJ61_06565 [Dehalococcoidia bacterium]